MRRLPDDLKLLYAAFFLGDLFLIAAKMVIDFRPGTLPWILTQELDLAKEAVFAAWYSSLQLLFVGLIALGHLYVPPGEAPRRTRWDTIGWLGIAAIFTWLSMDETSQVHERLGKSLSDKLGSGIEIFGIKDVYIWLIAFAPAAAAAAVYLAVFTYTRLRAQPLARALALAGVAFFLGSLSSEYLEGRRFTASHATVVREAKGWGASVEEGCEVLGATCFLVAFGESLRRRWPGPTPMDRR